MVLLSRSLLNFLRTFESSIRSSFFGLGKFCPTPGEFDHHFLPQGRELDKKNCLGGRDLLAQNKFSPGLPGGGGGGSTQLEITETLIVIYLLFKMSHENQMDAAQTLGFIKGLTAVVQEQSNAMKDTTDQIKQLAATVENLMKSQPQPQSMGLRLPNLYCKGLCGALCDPSFLTDPGFLNDPQMTRVRL